MKSGKVTEEQYDEWMDPLKMTNADRHDYETNQRSCKMAQFQTTPVSQLADSYDAVIVGSGGTGLAAAIQAHELGMNVAVLEKKEQLGGNTNRASSGMNAAETNVQLKHGIIDNINDFYRETYKDGGKLNDKDMLGFFVVHSPLAIDWLADHGIKLEDVTITGGMSKNGRTAQLPWRQLVDPG